MTRRLMRLVPAVLVLVTACGVADTRIGEGDESAGARAELGQAVKLLEAHSVIGTVRDGQWSPSSSPAMSYGGYGLTGLARGSVEVAAPRSDSRVFIHYESHRSNDAVGQWKVVEASRVDDRRFEFALEPVSMGSGWHYLPRFVHTFAVEHRSGRGSEWDNNGGRNYVVSGDDDGGWVPMFMGPTAVMSGNLVVERAQWDGAMLTGTLVVRNVGYGKRLHVVASTNDWATWSSGEASFTKAFSGQDFERWSFEVVAPAGATETVTFAAALDLPSGGTEWDNNLSRNYTLRLDGVGSPWALGAVASPGRLVFDGPAQGWGVRLDRAPPADGALVIVYDQARLPTCRGTKYGMPAWGLTPYVKRGDHFESLTFLKEGISYPAGVLHTQVVYVPNPAELYFVNSNAFGCVAWDSNYGNNFVVRW